MAKVFESSAIQFIAIVYVSLIAGYWLFLMDVNVPEPYLDEVFHVGQAQAYLRGRWDIWDPKLTTPPGLYLASWAMIKSALLIDIRYDSTRTLTDAFALRITNYIGSNLLAWLTCSLLFSIIKEYNGKCQGKHESNVRCDVCPVWSPLEVIHSSVNVYLFPPLFFFYGLYYTDVLSALSVLYAYRCHLRFQPTGGIFVGLLSLLFRQTNIFWVSVFLGGLQLCRTIPKGRPGIEFPSQPTFHDVIEGSWQHASAYDPLISQACFEDYIKTGISYAIAGLANPLSVVQSLSPHIILLGAFAQFVFWNGGVVLGDKDNHVASIHVAQMLYIWPYFAFFSWPLLYLHYLPQTGRLLSYPAHYPRITIICAMVGAMLVVVRYNTIVHPFTLADNRHYMFYVFRILLRHPLIKYLAVPVYVVCAWGTLAALGGPPTARQASLRADHDESSTSNQMKSSDKKRKFPVEEPFPPSPQPIPSPLKRSKPQESTLSSSSQATFSSRVTEVPQQNGSPSPPPKEHRKQQSAHRASFVLVWLLATALSLITTPLVEPRYLIVPWLIWRLHLGSRRPENDYAAVGRAESVGKKVFNFVSAVIYRQHDHRLWLETLWFLAINLVTGYIFLYWGFEWPQEPGKVQRFMW